MRKTITIHQQISIGARWRRFSPSPATTATTRSGRSGVRHMSISSDIHRSIGAAQAGDHTQEVMRVLGRPTRTEAIITAHEPNKHTAFRTIAGDLTANGYRQTQSVGDASVFTYHAEALLDPHLRFLARPIERLFNRRAAKDLRSLAKLLTKSP